MARLQINIIGELIRKTGDEMLECKNFGVTSLNEVRDFKNIGLWTGCESFLNVITFLPTELRCGV
jgi:DNA-directed RNA polymerase alpha subunit